MPIIKRNTDEITLNPADSIAISKGAAPKSFLSDGHSLYVLKKPRTRTFAGIFKESFPTELAQYRHWTIDDFRLNKDDITTRDKELLEPYAQHLNDLLFEAAFGEVLYQLIAKRLCKSFEPTENYLHIDQETGEPGIISKFRIDFNEFIEKKLQVAIKKKMMSAGEWATQIIPNRDDLDFSPHENYLLGKLYALALLTNDWDLVNNIMLSNAGCLGSSDSSSKIMVVDGGNKFHFGFGGLTCDETSFQNIEFNPHSTETHPLTGFVSTLPFDGAVYLKLPRLLIPDLFLLTNPNVFKGFKEAIEEARAALAANPFCIRQAIKEVELFITADSHEETIKRFKDKRSTLINHSYYFSTSDSQYSLDTVLKARCHSLQISCARIEAGVSVEKINSELLQEYRISQIPEIGIQTPPKTNSFITPTLPAAPLSIDSSDSSICVIR